MEESIKTLTEAYKPTKELKTEFFLEFRNLCKKYGVEVYAGEVEWKSEQSNLSELILAIYFEFYDGSTYQFSDGAFDPNTYTDFQNADNTEIIKINGI